MKKKLVVLTGAGISAESGIKTFRDYDGLWDNFSIEDVATPYGWKKDKQKVLDFYNARVRQLDEVEPNLAHKILAELENDFDVVIITQNVDDLHERAGSTKVLHLHGELRKKRSEKLPHTTKLTYDYYEDIKVGDLAPDGGQFRPHIVWFGEDVPDIQIAAIIANSADIFLVVGTSLNVYPAAGLLYTIPKDCQVYLIDPNDIEDLPDNVHVIKEKATVGMCILTEILK